ncbi:MAG: V-type ATPase subunit [Thermodesulfobacteriota bacterium]
MIRDVLSYLYVNAKVMAKEGKFISPMRWDDLWGCSSPAEVASLLEGTEYFMYLSERATDDSGELEKAIMEEFSSLAKEISDILPKGAGPIRDYLLRRWDVMNLRTIMRGIHGNRNKEEIKKALVEGGELSPAFLNSLLDAEDMEGFVGMLTKTPYHGLSEALGTYHAAGNLFLLETLLDKTFWEELLAKVLDVKGIREFRDFIEVCAETHNLTVILRAKKDNLSLVDVSPVLIPGCTITSELTAAFEEEEVSGLISLLEGSIFFEPLLGAQTEYEKTDSVFSFEAALDGMVAQKARDIRQKKPFGPGPLIGFIASKETEVKALLAVVRSTEIDLDNDMIREMMTR